MKPIVPKKKRNKEKNNVFTIIFLQRNNYMDMKLRLRRIGKIFYTKTNLDDE